jgi:endonuclease YncB( thermonuclease family)
VGVSKHWKPRKATVELVPSRIRRDPVREEKVREVRSREREAWGGFIGVPLFAAAFAVLVVGVSAVTFSRYDAQEAARARRFGQCYNSAGPNCVLDGDTIYAAGQRVEIAGLEAPQIQGAACAAERTRGVEAAVRLADLLNSDQVRVSRAFRDRSGREVRKVEVGGEDVGEAMIDAGAAREIGSDPDWCAK